MQPAYDNVWIIEQLIVFIKEIEKFPTDGHVYLLRHDNAYKIGKSFDVTRRYKEIRIQMPHDTEEIHIIETDDPSGIEAYRRLRIVWKRNSKNHPWIMKSKRTKGWAGKSNTSNRISFFL